MTTAAPDERAGWAAWWRGQGATSQAFVPGLYAWGVTVAPVAWSYDGVAAKVAASGGLLALFCGPPLERRAPHLVRILSGWGVVLSAVAVWIVSPDSTFATLDASRGLAGMLGWALFAFASASPAREPPIATRLASGLHPRNATSRRDTLVLFVGLGLAVLLELSGWRVVDRDRGLLVRMTALAGGLGLVTAAGSIAIHRGAPLDESRVPRPKRQRLRPRAVFWSLLASGLLALGALYHAWLSS